MQAFGLSDGSSILVNLMEPPMQRDRRPDPGTLASPVEVANWIGEAVAAGITFEVLKETAITLVKRGWSPNAAPASADEVAATVVRHLTVCGYEDVFVSEVRKVDGHGWTLRGTADKTTFKGAADEDGKVVHVRVK